MEPNMQSGEEDEYGSTYSQSSSANNVNRQQQPKKRRADDHRSSSVSSTSRARASMAGSDVSGTLNASMPLAAHGITGPSPTSSLRHGTSDNTGSDVPRHAPIVARNNAHNNTRGRNNRHPANPLGAFGASTSVSDDEADVNSSQISSGSVMMTDYGTRALEAMIMTFQPTGPSRRTSALPNAFAGGGGSITSSANNAASLNDEYDDVYDDESLPMIERHRLMHARAARRQSKATGVSMADMPEPVRRNERRHPTHRNSLAGNVAGNTSNGGYERNGSVQPPRVIRPPIAPVIRNNGIAGAVPLLPLAPQQQPPPPQRDGDGFQVPNMPAQDGDNAQRGVPQNDFDEFMVNGNQGNNANQRDGVIAINRIDTMVSHLLPIMAAQSSIARFMAMQRVIYRLGNNMAPPPNPMEDRAVFDEFEVAEMIDANQLLNMTRDTMERVMLTNQGEMLSAFTSVSEAPGIDEATKTQYRAYAVQCMGLIKKAVGMLITDTTFHDNDFVDEARNLLQMFNPQDAAFDKLNLLRTLLTFSNALRKDRYKRGPQSGMLYKEQYTVDGKPTRYWRPAKLIKTYVNEFTQDRLDQQLFVDVNNNVGMRNAIERHFEACDEKQLETMIPARGIFSFRNGIYNSNDNTFLLYTAPSFYHKYHYQTYAYNYFPMSDFNPAGFDAVNTGKYDFDTHGCTFSPIDKWAWHAHNCPPTHWSKQTLAYVTPFINAQQWPFEVMIVFLYALGRSQHEVGVDDQEQWSVLTSGIAGTGKSGVLNYLLEVFPFLFTGQLTSNMQDTFGLASFITPEHEMAKHIVFVTDMLDKLGISWDELKNMASNERVSSASKGDNEPRYVDRWSAPMWFCMNADFFNLPLDQMEAFLRRFPIFSVKHRPCGDAPGPIGYRRNMGDFIKVTHLAYHEWRRRLHMIRRQLQPGQPMPSNIWDHLPHYFVQQWHRIVKNKYSACEYLLSPAWFRKSPTNAANILTVSTICKGFKQWMRKEKPTSKEELPRQAEMSKYIRLCFREESNLRIGNVTDNFSGIRYESEEYVVGYEFAPNEAYEALLADLTGGGAEASRMDMDSSTSGVSEMNNPSSSSNTRPPVSKRTAIAKQSAASVRVNNTPAKRSTSVLMQQGMERSDEDETLAPTRAIPQIIPPIRRRKTRRASPSNTQDYSQQGDESDANSSPQQQDEDASIMMRPRKKKTPLLSSPIRVLRLDAMEMSDEE